jgi:hypothetical protein
MIFRVIINHSSERRSQLDFNIVIMVHSIQILGVSGHHLTKMMEEQVKKAKQQLSLSAQVEVVCDVNALILADIEAVPALIINGQLAVQGFIPNADKMTKLIRSFTSGTSVGN